MSWGVVDLSGGVAWVGMANVAISRRKAVEIYEMPSWVRMSVAILREVGGEWRRILRRLRLGVAKAQGAETVRTWGAAVLRPYTIRDVGGVCLRCGRLGVIRGSGRCGRC